MTYHKPFRIGHLLLLGMLGSTPFVSAQVNENTDAAKSAVIDLSVPDSPAFVVLNATPQSVTRPATPREVAASLLNGVDKNGNFQSGLAFDLTPYMVFAGDGITLHDYRTQKGVRVLSGSQVSLATTRGASDTDKSLRAALGFHITIFDRGDPRLDRRLDQCFQEKLVLPIPPAIAPPPDNASQLEKDLFKTAMDTFQQARQVAGVRNQKVAEDCRVDSRKRNWNKSSWIIAGAPAWISPTGDTKDFRRDGGGLWTSLAYGFEGVPGLQDHSQFILNFRYRSNESVPDQKTAGAFLREDSYRSGARLRLGGSDTNFSLEGLFVRSRLRAQDFHNASEFSFAFERRITDNIWFTASFGGHSALPNTQNKGFVLTSFRWGTSVKQDAVPGNAPK